MELDSYLTAKEVGDILHVTAAHVRYLCADGVIPSIKLGPRTIRIPAAEFKRWLDEKAMEKIPRNQSEVSEPSKPPDGDSSFSK